MSARVENEGEGEGEKEKLPKMEEYVNPAAADALHGCSVVEQMQRLDCMRRAPQPISPRRIVPTRIVRRCRHRRRCGRRSDPGAVGRGVTSHGVERK